MGNGPVTDNGTASAVDSVIKLAGNAIVDTVEAAIIADVPWLNFPVIKTIWEGLFEWIAGYFIKAAENGATFKVIDIQVSKEEKDLSTATQALISAKRSGDANAIKKAIEDYANAQSALIHCDGSSPAK